MTIVQFSDYQCPFCSRVEPTINQVMDEYKGKVRVVWRDLPLPFHPNAMPAAIAARAAGDQGKFWEMHDKIFADQQHMDRATYEKYAEELGLNMGKFKAALDAQKGKEAIEADAAAGGKIGARGTPAFFINGKFLSGAQPFESFKAKIDEELKNAEGLVAKGTPKAKVYEALMKDAKTEVPAAPAAAPAGEEKGPEAGHQGLRGRGRRLAVEGAEERAARRSSSSPTSSARSAAASSRRWRRWRRSTRARSASSGRTTRCPSTTTPSRRPRRRWRRTRRASSGRCTTSCSQNQQALDRADLEKYAQDLGLNMAKFKADLDASKYKSTIEAETKEGQAVGVNGTPAVFINGRKISGAYPFETFKKIADEELAKKTGKKRLALRRAG